MKIDEKFLNYRKYRVRQINLENFIPSGKID
jgi:hypothetical protein